jgi:hypothetical protein
VTIKLENYLQCPGSRKTGQERILPGIPRVIADPVRVLVWNQHQPTQKEACIPPGRETYPVFRQKEPLRVIENAVGWMGGAC